MSSSLREQLVRAGLASENDARKAAHQQNKQSKQARRKDPKQEERRRAAQQAQAAKAARDRELERKRKAKAERKARAAEIHQIVEHNRVAPVESDEHYHFADGGRVRRLPVTAELRRRVVGGELAIVRAGGRYALVPPAIAERVRERDPGAVVELPANDEPEVRDDDPYKDYVVPDDLVW